MSMHANPWRRAGGTLLALLLAGGTARAVYEPFPLRDPNRRWSVSLGTRSEYDDNIETAPSNTISSWKGIIEPQLLLNLPGEQTFLGLRYTYRAIFYGNRPGDKVDQANTGNLILSHTFTPRLSADLQDTVVRAVDPELVDIVDGAPLVTRRRGDYTYNNLNGSVRYKLSRRWTGSVAGQWTLWRYDLVGPDQDDRDTYEGTLGFAYALSPRTIAGLNYQYLRIDYLQPGSNDLRNSSSDVGFVSLVHRFNPLLSGQINAGGEFRKFDDGTSQVGPDLSASLSYTYALASVVTAGMRYGIASTEAGGYRSTDSLVTYGLVTHRFTPRLFGGATFSYTYSTFENPNPTVFPPPSPNAAEATLLAGANLRYQLTDWCSLTAGYAFDWVDSDVPGRSYNRNRTWLGLRIVY